tara:strand:- start:593 stop:751 length:159 start_codon:yes stop_codon:yes gene_type:complete
MYGSLEIEADDLDDAVELAYSNEYSLPDNGSYVDASFEVDHESVEDERGVGI